MKVLLSGANGMLGSNITRVLLDRGYQVRVFLLPNEPTPTLEGLEVERAFGNILDAAQVSEAMTGCEVVIHAAALTDVWPDRSEIVRRVNIDGTRNMFEAALAQGVKRFIYVGSGSSFAFGPPENPGHEESGFNGDQYGLDYIDSKHQAQVEVLNAVRQRGLPALVIAPTFMLGPFDSKPGAGQMVLAIHAGKMPFYTPGGRNFVHVRDVAVAVVNAIKKGRVGECYLAGHANLTYPEAFKIMGEVTGTKPPAIQAPGGLIKLFGRLGSLMGQLTGKRPVLSYAMARIGCDRQCFDCSKAVRELEMPQTPIKEAVAESFAWLKANGYVKK